jgi:CheY-like chemotaxis protein
MRGPVALFGTGKGKKEAGSSELVLAYLEDAQRVRCPFTLRDGRKLDVSAVVQALDEEAGTITFHVSGPFSGDKGIKVDFLFILEGMRLGGQGRLLENRSNLVVLALPEELELRERRKHARARLNPKEGATVTALTGLFDGTGINGVLENISESGCRVKVEKALNLKDEKRLHLGTALFSAGQALMLIKLNKLPKCPAVMELSGRVVYLSDSGGGLSVGIIFETPRGDTAAAIRSLVSNRASAIPASVPPKVRRKVQAAEDSLLAEPSERLAKRRIEEEPPPKEPGTPPPPPPPVPEPVQAEPPAAPEPVPAAEPDVETAPTPARNPALLRLKKRSRTVLLLIPSGYGNLLKDYLLDEGYGRVLMAASPQEMVSILAQDSVTLLLIDIGIPILECFEMVSNLKGSELELPPVIVAAEEVSRALVLAAHRSGISQLLVKPYALDESFATLLEQVIETC